MGLKERWEGVCKEVAEACEKCGRNPEDVKIVAVSKTVGADVVGEGIALGMTDFGENLALYPDANWHFIGTLQSNKAKQVVGKACLIHSLDRPSLLHAIQKEAAKLGVVQDVLVEVSISGEKSKGGIAPAVLPAFLEELSSCANIRCRGLMTMAPRGDAETARESFAGLRILAAKMTDEFGGRDNISMNELSMGMSEEWPEGATMVRIGRKIFSEYF